MNNFFTGLSFEGRISAIESAFEGHKLKSEWNGIGVVVKHVDYADCMPLVVFLNLIDIPGDQPNDAHSSSLARRVFAIVTKIPSLFEDTNVPSKIKDMLTNVVNSVQRSIMSSIGRESAEMCQELPAKPYHPEKELNRTIAVLRNYRCEEAQHPALETTWALLCQIGHIACDPKFFEGTNPLANARYTWNLVNHGLNALTQVGIIQAPFNYVITAQLTEEGFYNALQQTCWRHLDQERVHKLYLLVTQFGDKPCSALGFLCALLWLGDPHISEDALPANMVIDFAFMLFERRPMAKKGFIPFPHEHTQLHAKALSLMTGRLVKNIGTHSRRPLKIQFPRTLLYVRELNKGGIATSSLLNFDKAGCRINASAAESHRVHYVNKPGKELEANFFTFLIVLAEKFNREADTGPAVIELLAARERQAGRQQRLVEEEKDSGAAAGAAAASPGPGAAASFDAA